MRAWLGDSAELALSRFDQANCAMSGHVAATFSDGLNTQLPFEFEASFTDTVLKVDASSQDDGLEHRCPQTRSA